MEAERRTSKGSFFQLFDWNSKSKKKLFSNKSDSLDTETSKQGNQNVVKSLNYHKLLEVRENGHGLTGTRDGDCISSSVDDRYGKKAPGVVARLMGLDSLPTKATSEIIATPFCDASYSLNSCSQRCNSNFHIDYHYVNNIPNERGVQNRPIERFQSEMLPLKSAKQISMAHHHRLLSPIKNPGYIPTNDLAYIMEKSSKIIDQSPQSAAKSKKLHFVSSSVPLRIRDVRERMEADPRPREPVVNNRRHSREKNHNGSITTRTNNAPMSLEKESSGKLKNKGKTASLAVQAKVNVLIKEGLSSSNSESSQAIRSEMTMQRNVQKNSSISRTSGINKQNKQKQNCESVGEKLPPKASVPAQKNRKPSSVNGSVRSVRAPNKVSKLGARPGKINTIAKDNRTTIPETKQRAHGNLYFKDTIGDNITMSNDQNKQIISNITYDDSSSWKESGGKSSMDIVSFTFTSPIKKSHTVSVSSGKPMEDGAIRNIHHGETNRSLEIPDSYSPRSNVTGGDALSVLLEQKIKELTCRVESSNCYFDHVGSDSYTNNARDSSTNGECIGFELNLRKAKVTAFDMDCSSSNGKAYGKWKGLQETEGQSSCNSNRDGYRKEHKNQYSNLMSTLESSSSSDGSFDSSDPNCISITKGSKHTISNGGSETLDLDLEFSDSASSSSVAFSRNCNSSTVNSFEFKRSSNWELEFIRKILFSSDLVIDDLVLGQVKKVLNPNLFDHLENSQLVSVEDSEESFKLERKVLFDCVVECLELRGIELVGGNSNTLSKWETLFRNKGLFADDLYKEISSWTNMGDLMVDELVDRDMSYGKGKWVDFKTEAFDESAEIEKAIILFLIDELFADFIDIQGL